MTPTSVDELVAAVVAHAGPASGAEALVLGGSRARGTHQPGSDVDLCFYYTAERPLDLDRLGTLAAELDDTHRPHLLTAPGGWGSWINGGGWLTIQGQPVDFLYRDLTRVRSVIAACRAGQIEVVYQPGHPHAFVSPIYLGEVAHCQVLWDPRGTLTALKADARPYPPALRLAIVERFAWEVAFAWQTGHKAAARGDVTYAAGCCFRGAACLLQTLFALNEQYWLNEKGALALAATFPLCPPRLKDRVEALFSNFAPTTGAIDQAVAELASLDQDLSLLLQLRAS